MNKVDVDTLASLCSGISEPNEPDVLVHDVGTTATPVSFYAYMPYGGTPKQYRHRIRGLLLPTMTLSVEKFGYTQMGSSV